MVNEIIEVKESEVVIRDSDILNPNFNFDEKIAVATKVATSLKNVIESQGLAIEIPSKKGKNTYVTAEGWETLGVMLGCTPYVEEVVEIETERSGKFYYVYRATVSIRQGDTIISRASAIAERNEHQRDRPSVYSMAQTRALGKGYRMALSWIVKMAGYEPTPAEEMPRFREKDVLEAKVSAEMKQRKKEQEIVPQKVVDVKAEPVDDDVDVVDQVEVNQMDDAEEIASSIIAELPNKTLLEAKKELARLLKLEVISNDECKKILAEIEKVLG